MSGKSEYLFISSADSMTLFPDNNGGNFLVLIPRHLSREWEIGLKEIYIKISPILAWKHILICCEQFSKSVSCNNEFGILRSVYLNNRIMNLEFKQTYYFRFTHVNIEYLHIFLINENGEQFSEMGCYVKCVLHCRKHKS